jgi:hypothetical protein
MEILPIYLSLGDEKTAVRFKVDIHCSDSGKRACFGFLSAHPQIKIEDIAHNVTPTLFVFYQFHIPL